MRQTTKHPPDTVCTFRCPRHGLFKFDIMSEHGYLLKEARCPECGFIVLTKSGAAKKPIRWLWKLPRKK